MSREIRHVPENWEHPKYLNIYRGIEYRPLGNGDYQEDVREWRKELRGWYRGYKAWQRGRVYTYMDFIPTNQNFKKEWMTIEKLQKRILEGILAERKQHNMPTYEEEQVKKLQTKTYRFSDYAGEPPIPPNPEDYMPSDGPWLQLYETVSEGTPLSPPFPTPEKLLQWMATHKDFSGDTWTPEQADAMLKDEWAPSAVFVDGKWLGPQEALVNK